MSPIILDVSDGEEEERLHGVGRVAIIGAGPGGLSAAKYLLAEKKFSQVDIYEQRPSVGGTWNYTGPDLASPAGSELDIPRTCPSTSPDTPVYNEKTGTPDFVGPVYDCLEANIPNTLMNFWDQPFPKGTSLFPPHPVIKDYLETYAQELRPYLKLSHQVMHVEKPSDSESSWVLESKNLLSGQVNTCLYDAILVANGHYSDAFIPDIAGVSEFASRWPGSVLHSKFYRNPSAYTGKKVIVVGHSASGIDISSQIAAHAKLPVIISEKPTKLAAGTSHDDEPRSWARFVRDIVSFDPPSRSVRYSDGSIEDSVDAVVFCTGYFYTFPFLPAHVTASVSPDGTFAHNLYEHIFYIPDPTLAFIGIPQRVVPFPISEAQSALVARAWAGRLALPGRREMHAWEQDKICERCGGEGASPGKTLHTLTFPRDIEYINSLHQRTTTLGKMDLTRVEGLDNNGLGKIPPYWGDKIVWTRERFPKIKAASRALGDRRHEVKTMAELGFDYDSWIKAREAEEPATTASESVDM